MRNIILWSVAFLLLFLGMVLITLSYQTKSTITGFGVREFQTTQTTSEDQDRRQEESTLKRSTPVIMSEPVAAEASVDVSITIIPSSKNA